MESIKIEVIGSGCKKCKALFELTKEVVNDLGITDPVEYSTDIMKITAMGLIQSPVVTINGEPILIGSLPNKETLTQIIHKKIFNNPQDGTTKRQELGEKRGGCCSCGGKC